MLTISGHLGASAVERVSTAATRHAVAGTALILDLVDLNFAPGQAMSLLVTVDDACADAAAPWVLVPSQAVRAALRRAGCEDAVVTAGSVPAAIRYLTSLARARLGVVTATSTAMRGVR